MDPGFRRGDGRMGAAVALKSLLRRAYILGRGWRMRRMVLIAAAFVVMYLLLSAVAVS